ncbi:succinylglutamate-semialdehyde dehydrogenase [Simkania negevensis]|uniref:Succinylglutamate-semialdehyde dehydrogenase n=1 Tax=Simkania negevensis TaxID=83561 RepID=A0ABS3AS29_9BACT|nr:succinylglutamate-semialdehyde dehydrogenase [Simkania negevensis]
MEVDHYINGEWIEGQGNPFASNNPATGDIVWEGHEATEKEVKSSVIAARKAFISWSSSPLAHRLSFLEKFINEVEKNKQRLAEAVSMEIGKPLWESTAEVNLVGNKYKLSLEAFSERCGEQLIEEKPRKLTTRFKPLGVLAIFAPFNFPVHLPCAHIIPALIAGNTVVLKPSVAAAYTTHILMECFEHAGFPAGVVNMIQGDKDTGHFLSLHPQVDGLLFTGSYETGRMLAETYCHHPEKILALEMGGNNPLIVHLASDPEAAAYHTILSSYITAGQRCTCARRLIVPEGQENDDFLHALLDMLSAIQVGAYTSSPEPFMGPVVNAKSATKCIEMQQTLLDIGGKPIKPMEHLQTTTGFLSPGIIDMTEATSPPDREIFGPLIQLYRVKDFDAAIQEANNTSYGLSAALFSRHKKLFERFFHEVRAGIINWNSQTTGASGKTPFGGIGYSGNHRPAGYHACDCCSYPIASIEAEELATPTTTMPGINLKQHDEQYRSKL